MSETDAHGGVTPKRAEAAPRRRVWRLTALLAALTLALAAPAASPAASAAGDSTAVAVNEEDGSTLFDFAFSIRRAGGEVVDDTNVAVAYSSCQSCQTVALALQVVLVLSEPDVITPTNLAIAVNENCTTCTTAALAYQYVIGDGGVMRFTAEGNRRIAAIRRELRELRRSGLSLEELLLRIDALRAELVDILKTELVAPGAERDGRGRGDDGGGDGGSVGGSPPDDERPSGAATDEGGDGDMPGGDTTSGGGTSPEGGADEGSGPAPSSDGGEAESPATESPSSEPAP